MQVIQFIGVDVIRYRKGATKAMKNMNRTVAFVFGIVFLMIGVLGFVPALTPGGALLGLFMVNGLHSIVHLLFGVLGIAAASTGFERLYNRAGGVIYLLLGVLGLIPALVPGGLLLGLVMINGADNILHLVIGAVLAYVGFAVQLRRSAAARA
jgi:hypothetical protein